ncbi:MAG: phosphoribosylaminoimidazolesuccinocarboxamide synthase [bacterium]
MTHSKSNAPHIFETNLPWKLRARGKVRDIYEIDERHLLVVTTDRLSAFDHVLPTPIPDRGRVLVALSHFWLERLKGIIGHHLADEKRLQSLLAELPKDERRALQGRTELVRAAKVFPVECVVRGYLAGSGWTEYQRSTSVCGVPLPKGLMQSQRLPEPIFTPATKATSGHDENISFETMAGIVGKEIAQKLRDTSIRIYRMAADHAEARGILIADTKFEFGEVDGEIVLVDEILTPDSSRFWPGDRYQSGRDQESLDKQIVRNYLTKIGWNREPPIPTLPPEIASQTREAYLHAYSTLTGRELAV